MEKDKERKEREISQAVRAFAEAVIESMKESDHQSLEPFEAYTERLQAEIHQNADQFCDRFVKGYFAIMKQLRADNEGL
jgi:hypothetical protein